MRPASTRGPERPVQQFHRGRSLSGTPVSDLYQAFDVGELGPSCVRYRVEFRAPSNAAA
jgi:hypothetical protein